MKSFLNNHTVRGLRNNNPGNLVKTKINWQGKILNGNDARFEQFENIYFGIRAQIMDVINDIKKGKNTIRKLIHEYAPSFENDTNGYINSVAKTIGINPDAQITNINAQFIQKLSRAIYKVELGKYHTDISDADIKKAYSMLPNMSSHGITVEKKN